MSGPAEQRRLSFITAAALAGLALNAGFAWARLRGSLAGFDLFWAAHLILLAAALAFAVAYVHSLAGRSGRAWLPLVLGAALLLPGMICALAPPLQKDALSYHLFVPQQWAQHRALIDIPWNAPSYFPLLTSLGYLGLLQHGSDLLTGFYHGLYLLLGAVLTVVFARSIFKLPARQALWAFPLFTSIPLIIRLSGEPMADGPVIFFFGAGVLLSLELLDHTRTRRAATAAAGAGICFGLALSAKYTPLLASALYAGAWAALAITRGCGVRGAARSGAILAAAALATASPWLLRNYVATGDPIYPFLAELLGRTETHAFIGALSPMQFRMAYYQEGLLDYLLLPLRLVLLGRDNSGRYFDGSASPLLLLFAVPLFLRHAWAEWETEEGRGMRRTYVTLALFVLAHTYAAPLFHKIVLRYYAPLAVPLIAGSLFGAAALCRIRPASSRRIASLLLLIGAGWSGWYARGLLQERGVVEYLRGPRDRREYLARHLADYPLIETMNRTLGEGERAYLLYSANAFYYFERPVAGELDPSPILTPWLRGEGRACSFPETLDGLGATHVAVHAARMARVVEAYCAVSPEGCRRWAAFVQQCLRDPQPAGPYVLWRRTPGAAEVCRCDASGKFSQNPNRSTADGDDWR